MNQEKNCVSCFFINMNERLYVKDKEFCYRCAKKQFTPAVKDPNELPFCADYKSNEDAQQKFDFE